MTAPTTQEPSGKSLILGLTGSLGSGKSFVSSLLRCCQARVVCADELAREVVQPGTTAFEEIRRTFGDEVVSADGTLDRQRLARIVFRDPSQRQKLESIIHPRVRTRELELIDQHQGFPLVVLDVPLLYESGMNAHCDKVAVVHIDEEVRHKRLLEGRGMKEEEIKRRLAAQMPQADKVRLADHLIDNSGSRPETADQVNFLLLKLFPDGLPFPLRQTTPQDIQTLCS